MHLRRLALYLLVLLLLAGCDSAESAPPQQPPAPPPPAPADSGPVTITWAFWGSPPEIAVHQQVGEAFMASHPAIKLEMLALPWSDYFTEIQSRWAGSDPAAVPDVLFVWPAPAFAATGVLENLDPWLEKSGFTFADYWPALPESVMVNGSVYGLPRDINVEVLYYNKSMFDEAGLAYPTDAWSWADLQTAVDTLSQLDEGGRVARYGLAMAGSKYQLWVGQNRGAILDDMRNPSHCTLAEPPALEAIKFFAGLMNNNQAMRDAALSQAGGDAAVFLSGQAAMIIQNFGPLAGFNQAGLNYDVAAVPLPPDGQRSASAGGGAWVMSARSDNKEEAWELMSWLQNPDGGQKIYSETGLIFPALQATARSAAFLQAGSPPANRQAFLTEAENAKVGRFGYFPEWGELDGAIISPGLQRVWSGETTAEAAVPEICQQVDAFLAQHGYPRQ